MIRRLVWPLIAIALLVAAATTAPTTRSHTSKPDRAALPPLPELPELPHASMLVDSARSEMVLELPPTDVPAAGMVRLPVFQAVIPVSAAICHFHMEVVDLAGRRLPQAMLHHFNLSDPERRELFLPIGLHIMAASKETPAATVPRLLFGLPLERGQRLIASGMLGNETATLQRGVRVPLVLFYRWYRLGIHITPRQTYRLTAVYENPTGRVLRDGGMGAVAGLFVPDRGATWPAVDPADSIYRADLHDTLWQTAEEMMGGMKMHGDH